MSLLVILLVIPAHGHDLQASWTSVRFRPDSMELKIRMAADTVRSLIQDEAPLATFEPENFEKVRPLLREFAKKLYEVKADGQPLVALQSDVAVVEDNIEFRLIYPRTTRGPLFLKANYLDRVIPGYFAHVNVTDEAEQPLSSQILKAESPSMEVALPSEASRRAVAVAQGSSFKTFLKLGVEHILTGYDHLLFLCGLLVVCRRFKSMAAIITCFTLAHSITLALAALDLITISGRIVEPLIAASIVFVGLENLLRRDEPRWRWALTFAFGLIHGFGFAGVLKEVGLGSAGSGLLVPLFSFNLGVELGQIAVTAIVLPLLWWLRRLHAYERYGRQVISVMVALIGAYWLVERIFFS
ncbi:MAG TPA: HupE/UreJ family protein [Pyrinomonadaceae bacterium]